MLIDTGSGERKWIDTLRTVLTSSPGNPLVVSTCLLTHWHHDHLGGVKDLETLHQDLHPQKSLTLYKNQPSWNPDGLINPSAVHDITNGQQFSIPQNDSSAPPFEVQALHTPGHAKDHMVFQITSSDDPTELGALFTADNVLGHGTAVFEDLALYLDSLNTMKQKVKDAVSAQQASSTSSASGSTNQPSPMKRAYPGHGQLIEDSVAKIDEYIAHRRMREDEALNVLRYGTVKPPNATSSLPKDSITTTGDSDVSDTESTPAKLNLGGAKEFVAGKEWSSLEMVKVIYRHYPENLWEPAERGLVMVLEKLKRDGKVVNVGVESGSSEGMAKGRWRVSEKATL